MSSLNPEYLLLVLCVHGSKHHWHKLGWICDIAQLVHTYQDIDWERLLKQAKKLGCERMLLIGLILANHLLATPLPETGVTTELGENRTLRPQSSFKQCYRKQTENTKTIAIYGFE